MNSSNIYEKNRISYINTQRINSDMIREFNYKTKSTCYIIVGLLTMYIGLYMIINSIYKGTIH